jgi:5-methylcytosine-specific restriction endonuclease McrA
VTLAELLNSENVRKVTAWQKAVVVTGYNPAQYRMDRFGLWIAWDEYGKCTQYGWEIDHVWPSSLGGLNTPGNLEALHWRNNRAKSNRIV